MGTIQVTPEIRMMISTLSEARRNLIAANMKKDEAIVEIRETEEKLGDEAGKQLGLSKGDYFRKTEVISGGRIRSTYYILSKLIARTSQFGNELGVQVELRRVTKEGKEIGFNPWYFNAEYMVQFERVKLADE